MERARIDITQDLEGDAVVHAVFDLSAEQLAAAAHAIGVTARERFRMAEISADEVVEMRELTALADELSELRDGASTVVMKPARLSAFRDALSLFVESRERAEWIREADREPLALLRELLLPLEQLSLEAMRAALAPDGHRSHS